MSTKIILIIFIVYYLFFSKISENFSSYHDCLSTVAGRMLFQKESIENAIVSAKNQSKCLVQEDENSVLNEFSSWKDTNMCKRFLVDTNNIKNFKPNDVEAQKWFDVCILKIKKLEKV